MDATYIVLIALTAVYIPLFLYVKFSDRPKGKGLVPYGPCIMIRTKVGMATIERLAKYRRFWRVYGKISRAIVVLLMTYIVAIIILDILLLPMMIGKPGMGIEYALAIPGLNPMLPIVYGWIGLIIAMVFHELAHGIQSRANDIDVDSTGLLLAVVPVGAFVEPNEGKIEAANRSARIDLYAAGITMNFVIAILAFALMFSMASCTLESEYGDNPAVYGFTPSSPLMDSEIPTTAVIVGINGTPVDNMDDLNDLIDGYGEYDLTYVHMDAEYTKHVTLGTFVNSIISGSPISHPDIGIEPGDYIVGITVNGTLYDIGTPGSMTNVLEGTVPGQSVTITYYDGDAEKSAEITLGDKNGIGYLGVTTTLSGMSLTTPDIILKRGIDPYYEKDSVEGVASGTLSYIAMAFKGFSPVPESTHWWYSSTIMDDQVAWVLLSLLFWIFWLNIVLGVTNALPAVPFDGGFLFMGGVDYLMEKFVKDKERKERIVNRISGSVTYFMLLSLVLVIAVIVF